MSERLEQSQAAQERPKSTLRKVLARIPWWVSALLLIAMLFIYAVLTNPMYRTTFSWMVFGRPNAAATEGIRLTIEITLIAFALATVLGLITGLARVSSNVIIFNAATFYVEIVRGIPLVVLILYTAYVLLPVVLGLLLDAGTRLQLISAVDTRDIIRSISDEARGIVALAFGYGAYEAEIFRAGIQSIERGQMEAARSLGMTYFQAMRYVILPQAIRRVLPPLGNDFIAMLKDSSLVAFLAVPELTFLGRQLRGNTYQAYPAFNTVAVLYLSMTIALSFGVRLLERKMSGERTSSTIR